MYKLFLRGAFVALLFAACQPADKKEEATAEPKMDKYEELNSKYTSVKLTTDISKLSESHKQMIPKLVEVAQIMDKLFWYEAFGEKESLLDTISDSGAKRFAEINYGPWDRLNGNQAFIDGVGEKPEGANFYPQDMTKEEFEAAELEDKASLYTFIRRNDEGNLESIPYNKMFKEDITRAAQLLTECSELAENPELKKYLALRAEALLTDDYYNSDIAWMDMKTNQLDMIVGPIETYEDQLFGYKAAHEAYILVKDMDWSKKLSKYAELLPELQKGLPVAAEYKAETPGTDSQLAAFDVIYYAGDCNAGSKTIAVNLPNDEEVQLKKGTRRSQLKNAMKAKFDKILVPIADLLIAEEQRKHITFDAFFANTMFHEVAHGLGIKNTINGKGTVREALKENASALEEGKADILGLYMITKLHEQGEVDGDLNDYYTTFMASIFRSVRFGASSAHGKANMIRFNFFKEMGAFQRGEDGYYTINYDKMTDAMNALSEKILMLQGNGDYEGVGKLVDEKANIGAELQGDLDRLSTAGIPVDVVFEQGVEVLGL
ncbi:dipeptidyl-peptidase 3 family protein [Fulvivirga lutea]|uniref:Zn-dependent hydrolase n=1 Tax=Fulvivirga lutea TaxID=2810512 RepID=A0A974WH68_9BACT|nr:Zn-dependent hydrolase [Fulvivirga lutea]